MSIKLITEQLLLGGPRAGSLDRLHLFVPGELPRQRLTFCRRIVVFASPNNPGALEVAKDLALATGNCIEVTSDETNAMITHFLLYLNDQTYLESAGKELAEEIRRARAVRETWRSTIEIVMVHENEPERGGCEFGIFFDGRTPKDLEDSGVYNVRTLYYYVPSVSGYMSLTISHHVYPSPRRRSRRRSTPGGSGRSLPRLWPRRWARPLPPALARGASRLRRHCAQSCDTRLYPRRSNVACATAETRPAPQQRQGA